MGIVPRVSRRSANREPGSGFHGIEKDIKALYSLTSNFLQNNMAIYQSMNRRPITRPAWKAVFHDYLPDRVLVWYRQGLLSAEDREMLEAHLALCPICQLQLGDLNDPAVRDSEVS
jgi:hypothetical protein